MKKNKKVICIIPARGGSKGLRNKNILKLLHPFAPFITEEIWSFFNNDEVLLTTASYPEIISEFKFSKQKENIEFLMSVISSIRNIKTSLGVSPKNEVTILCRGSSDKTDILVKNKHHLSQLVNVGSIDFGENIEKPEQSATAVVENLEIFLPQNFLLVLTAKFSFSFYQQNFLSFFTTIGF